MAQLVSLARALVHLRLIASPDDIDEEYPLEGIPEASEVLAKLEDASAIVLAHVKDPDNDAEWDEGSTPGEVQAATLIVLSDLWEHRAGSSSDDVVISETMRNLLRGRRDPTLA